MLLLAAAPPAPIYRNAWTTNAAAGPVQGANNLQVSNANDVIWSFFSGSTSTVARITDVTAATNNFKLNQFTTNVVGTPVLGPVAFDGAVTINGAVGVGGPTIISNIVQANNLVITNNGSLGFGTNLTAPDMFLVRDNAPNIMAQRNGTTAQQFNIYNTYTTSGNNEYGTLWWTANQFVIGTFANGAGSGRNVRLLPASGGSLVLGASGGDKWTITTAGNLTANTDATSSIGATNASRPNIIYLSRGLVIGPNAGGGFLTNILTARVVLDFPSTAADSSSDLAITVTGATTNDVATVQAPPVVQLANSTWTCFASNDTVYIRFTNIQTVGALDPGPASFSVKVDRF